MFRKWQLSYEHETHLGFRIRRNITSKNSDNKHFLGAESKQINSINPKGMFMITNNTCVNKCKLFVYYDSNMKQLQLQYN